MFLLLPWIQRKTFVRTLNSAGIAADVTQDGTCRPQQPTAFMMEALWMTLYGIPAFTALRTRSLWVVALQQDAVSQTDTDFWPYQSSEPNDSTHPNGSPTTRNATSVT